MGSPGPSTSSLVDTGGKKHLRDLLHLIPECDGSQWIENIDSIFELLDEKLSTLLDEMTDTMLDSRTESIANSWEVFQKARNDCSGMRYLIEVQKEKLGVILSKNRTFQKRFPFNARLEKRLLHSLFPDKASSVKHVSVRDPETVGERTLLLVRKSPSPIVSSGIGDECSVNDIKWVLLYPSAMFTISEIRARTTGSLSSEHLKNILTRLSEMELVKFCPLTNDCVIVKNFSNRIEKQFEQFNLTREEMISVSTPESLQKFRDTIDHLPSAIIRIFNRDLYITIGEILIATLMLDDKIEFRHSELPQSLPRVIEHAMGAIVETLIARTQLIPRDSETIDYRYTKRIESTEETLYLEQTYLGRI